MKGSGLDLLTHPRLQDYIRCLVDAHLLLACCPCCCCDMDLSVTVFLLGPRSSGSRDASHFCLLRTEPQGLKISRGLWWVSFWSTWLLWAPHFLCPVNTFCYQAPGLLLPWKPPSIWFSRLFSNIYFPVDTLYMDAELSRHPSGKTNQPQLRIYRLKRP